MAEEEWIGVTQETLGKLIAKPKMTEKYLKKPPFRFLHDIIMEVNRTTGFGAGLFTDAETDAAHLADKQAKVDFLNKSISCVCFALGDKIDVSANKIVAGLEAEKTNAWLQKLHEAATTAVDKSPEAVARVQAGESVAAPRSKKKPKDEDAAAEKPPEAAGDGAAPDAAAEEDAKKEEDRRRREARKKKEEEKRKKAAEEEAAKAAEEAGAGGEAAGGDAEAEEADRRAKREEEKRKKEEDRKRREERKQKQAEEEQRQREAEEAAAAQQQQALVEQQQQQAALAQQQAMLQQQAEEEQRRAAAAAMYSGVPDEGADGMPSAPGSAAQGVRPVADPGMAGNPEEAMLSQGGEDDMGMRKMERPRTAGRKPPKVTSKVKQTTDEPGLAAGVAPPTIIAEGTKDDDDDDMFEAPAAVPGLGGPAVKADENAPHGKLVQDLLREKKSEEEKERLRKEEEDTREEVDDPSQKGIKMGRLKRKKEQGSNFTEIDTAKLSESIQQLCQAANPLGKSIDLVHQDIANMGKELDHWKQEYREASEEHTKQLKETDELLQPLYQKIAELDDRIAEQKTKIRNSRSRISKNDLKVSSLLESVVMAK